MRSNVLESVLSFVIAPGGIEKIDALSAQAIASVGQSLQIRKGSGAILNPWGNNQVTGGMRIRSGTMHNNLQNINMIIVADQCRVLMGDIPNSVYSQDTLSVSQWGSAVGGQIEQNIIPIWYNSVEGLNANLLTAHEVLAYRASGQEAGKERVSVMLSLTGGTDGNWGGAVSLSTLTGYGFKPNRYYAVTGLSVDTICCAISFHSTENAGVHTAVPGDPSSPRQTSRFFMDLSQEYGRPTVPIFSAASLADAVVEVACNDSGGTFGVTLHAILLNDQFSPANLV